MKHCEKAMTRRQACLLGIGVLGGAALGLPGCKSQAQRFADGESDSTEGFAGDSEVKSYPVTLKVYVDSDLRWMPGGSAAVVQLGLTGLNHIEEYVARYRSQHYRDQVTIDLAYASPADLALMAQSGFPDGDGVLARKDIVVAGEQAGTIDGGTAGVSVRDMSYNFPVTCVMVRAAGSAVELPPARTLSGKETSDGSISQFQQLPSFDGLLAIADPATTSEGLATNRMLAREGFYTSADGIGGDYSDSVKALIRLYPDQDAAMVAVASGECSAGFALTAGFASRYPQVEKFYEPSGGSVAYAASALSGAAEPGVVRDFFEFITKCTD